MHCACGAGLKSCVHLHCVRCCAGFEDHVSYGCADYRRTVATVLQQIDLDPALLSDDRRVEVELVHV